MTMTPTDWLILIITTSVVVIVFGVWFYRLTHSDWHLKRSHAKRRLVEPDDTKQDFFCEPIDGEPKLCFACDRTWTAADIRSAPTVSPKSIAAPDVRPLRCGCAHGASSNPTRSAPSIWVNGDIVMAELLDKAEVLRLFGGNRPINASTLYRGIKLGRYPKPIRVGPNSSRWLLAECQAALRAMVEQRSSRLLLLASGALPRSTAAKKAELRKTLCWKPFLRSLLRRWKTSLRQRLRKSVM